MNYYDIGKRKLYLGVTDSTIRKRDKKHCNLISSHTHCELVTSKSKTQIKWSVHGKFNYITVKYKGTRHGIYNGTWHGIYIVHWDSNFVSVQHVWFRELLVMINLEYMLLWFWKMATRYFLFQYGIPIWVSLIWSSSYLDPASMRGEGQQKHLSSLAFQKCVFGVFLSFGWCLDLSDSFQRSFSKKFHRKPMPRDHS